MVINIKTEKIMKKLLNISIVFLAAFLIGIGFNSCEDENDYDFSKIVPVLRDISAETYTPMEGRYQEFWATTRGGSTYSWSTEGTATWVENPDNAGQWKTFIYFPDVIDVDGLGDDPEFVYVTETTAGGVTSNTLTSDSIKTVVPFAARPILGPEIANGGFIASFSADVTEGDKQHSTYTWECTAGTVTVNAKTWMVDIAFANEDTGLQTITMVETTDKGFTDESTFVVEVLEYCALESNDDLVGIWSGLDGMSGALDYDSEVVTSSATATGVTIGGLNGLNAGWMFDWWGETTLAGGKVPMIVNEDGTVEILRQYYITTLYDGEEYDYEIEGEGRWNNCGDYPTLTINYILYNSDGNPLPSTYYGAWPTFTAVLVMDGGVTKHAVEPKGNIERVK